MSAAQAFDRTLLARFRELYQEQLLRRGEYGEEAQTVEELLTEQLEAHEVRGLVFTVDDAADLIQRFSIGVSDYAQDLHSIVATNPTDWVTELTTCEPDADIVDAYVCRFSELVCARYPCNESLVRVRFFQLRREISHAMGLFEHAVGDYVTC